MKQTRRQLVLSYMLEHGSATTAQLNSKEVGGTEGTKRLRELRLDGVIDYTREKIKGSSQWRYTLKDLADA